MAHVMVLQLMDQTMHDPKNATATEFPGFRGFRV